jgi:hypothetical protein
VKLKSIQKMRDAGHWPTLKMCIKILVIKIIPLIMLKKPIQVPSRIHPQVQIALIEASILISANAERQANAACHSFCHQLLAYSEPDQMAFFQ